MAFLFPSHPTERRRGITGICVTEGGYEKIALLTIDIHKKYE